MTGEQQIWEAIREGNTETHDLATDVGILTERVDTLAKSIEKLVTRHEFDPVKMIVFGMAGSVLAGVVAALLALVVARH